VMCSTCCVIFTLLAPHIPLCPPIVAQCTAF